MSLSTPLFPKSLGVEVQTEYMRVGSESMQGHDLCRMRDSARLMHHVLKNLHRTHREPCAILAQSSDKQICLWGLFFVLFISVGIPSDFEHLFPVLFCLWILFCFRHGWHIQRPCVACGLVLHVPRAALYGATTTTRVRRATSRRLSVLSSLG